MEPNQNTPSFTGIPLSQKWKKLIIWLTVLCAGLSIYTILLTFQSVCRGGLGCIGMLPFVIPTIFAYPAIYLVSLFFPGGGLHQILGAPSLFKFYAFFVVFAELFIVGCIIAWLYIYYKRRKDGTRQGIGKDVWYAVKKLATNLLIIFFIFSLFNFVSKTPVPFVPDHEIILYCDNMDSFDQKCFSQYINYKIADCSGRGSMFLWPYERKIEKPDSCKLSNFGKFAKFEIYNLDDANLMQSYPEMFPISYSFGYAMGRYVLKNINDLSYSIKTSNGIKIVETSLTGVLYSETNLTDKSIAGEDGLWPGNTRTDLKGYLLDEVYVYVEYGSMLYNGYYADKNYEALHFVKGNTYFKITNEHQRNLSKKDTQESREKRVDLLKDIAKNFIEQPSAYSNLDQFIEAEKGL